MASVLEYLLQGEVSPDSVVKWLNEEVCDQASERLKGLESLKEAFIPFFLNCLRDHTIHLLQSAKTATPSPAKVPSLQKHQKSASRKENCSKRQQLFGSSPAGDASEDIRDLSSSVFSPNTSLESPGVVNARGDYKNQRSNSKQRGNGQKKSSHSGNQWSPQCGSQKSYQASDHRSKQKLSLGEFFATPDRNNNGSSAWRKSTSNSGNRKDSGDLSLSPNFGHGKRSGGRKKQSLSPLVQNESRHHYLCSTPKQAFSIDSSSDFPPMSADKQPCDQTKDGHRLSSRVSNTSNNCDKTFLKQMNGDVNISRQIDFSTPNKDVLPDLSSVTTKSKDVVSSETNLRGARRVTPTLIKVDKSLPQNSAFLAAEESDPSSKHSSKISFPGTSASGHKSVQHELTRKENQSIETDTSTALVTPKKSTLEHSTSQTEDVEASREEVTHQDKLDILVSLYSKCLEDNLLPNVVVELYFLMQLLTARGEEEEKKANKKQTDVVEENYFSTVHNTVYFAVNVLQLQKRLLAILDRATLRLLCENQRVIVFSNSLQIHLDDLYERSEVKRGPTYQRSPIGCVSFQADTDNKKSFPTEKCFHLFKRQRDSFYELIREWEASRMNPEYNMEEVFGARVRTIIGPHTHLANHIHFARLFQSQLLAMNKGEVSVSVQDEDENISLLSQLKRSNPAKFKRLQERFIKPLSLGGPCPPPAFPGCQEFFRDFILTASNPILNQHLSDTFAAKILEINEMCIGCQDDDDDTGGGNEDDEGRELCCSMLMDLKVLAKFLGFVTFLPYQSPDGIPVAMEMDCIALRNKQVPPIDMYECLQVAGTSGYLMFTVPWVVDFLSMMDGMAARIDHYQRILYMLLHIHRCTWSKLRENLHYSNLITVCVISWLLENPVMPDGFFFMEIPEDIQRKAADCLPSQASVESCSSVDQAIFYTCCPYIGEMKALLVDFAVGSNCKALSTRKITPVSTGSTSDRPITDRQLQLQLEENFFHNHPASLKRVVVFVADRTASNYIKKFRAGQLQETFVAGKDRVHDLLMSQSGESPVGKLKERTTQVVTQVVQDLLAKVKTTVRSDAPRYFEEEISPLLLGLLPYECPMVVNMAGLISSRIAREKVLNWINKHVTAALLKTEVSVDVEKICRTLIKNSETDLGYHDELASQKTETQSIDKSMEQCTSLLNNRVNNKLDAPSVALSIDNDREVPSDTKTTETLLSVSNESVGVKSAIQSSSDSDNQMAERNQRLCHVTATEHCDLLKHPSEVLLDFKDFVKGISLQNKQVTEDTVLQHLALIKKTLEQRQDIIPSVHRSFAQLTVDLLVSLLVSHPSPYTQAVIDTCIQLWTTLLWDSTLRTVFSGRVVFLVQSSSDTEIAWQRYTDLLIRLCQRDILKVADIQEAALVLIQYVKDSDMLSRLCRCLCNFAEVMIPAADRIENFGECLEMLYNHLPSEESKEAETVLQALGMC